MIVSALMSLLMLVQSSGPATANVVGRSLQGMHFRIERAEALVPVYTIVVQEYGDGATGLAAGSYVTAAEVTEGTDGSVPITITPQTMAKIFAARPMVLAGQCDSHAKNVANTGKKTLTVFNDGKPSQCVFNYSGDEKVNAAASAFQAIAQTLQTGTKLKHDHRFDHLGLDADLDGLASAVKNGYAIELQNIAPELQSIIEDEEMMSAVRRKAAALLQISKNQVAASAR